MACQWKKARTGRFKVSGHGIHMSFMCLRLVKILVLTSNEHMPICYPTALPYEEFLLRYGLPAQDQELSSETRADPVRTLRIKSTNGSSQHPTPSRDWLFTGFQGFMDIAIEKRFVLCYITANSMPGSPIFWPAPGRSSAPESRRSLYHPIFHSGLFSSFSSPCHTRVISTG